MQLGALFGGQFVVNDENLNLRSLRKISRFIQD
jgi:hypothetical protein